MNKLILVIPIILGLAVFGLVTNTPIFASHSEEVEDTGCTRSTCILSKVLTDTHLLNENAETQIQLSKEILFELKQQSILYDALMSNSTETWYQGYNERYIYLYTQTAKWTGAISCTYYDLLLKSRITTHCMD